MYLGTSLRHPGSIIVYNPTTKRVYYRGGADFQVLEYIPKDWNQQTIRLHDNIGFEDPEVAFWQAGSTADLLVPLSSRPPPDAIAGDRDASIACDDSSGQCGGPVSSASQPMPSLMAQPLAPTGDSGDPDAIGADVPVPPPSEDASSSVDDSTLTARPVPPAAASEGGANSSRELDDAVYSDWSSHTTDADEAVASPEGAPTSHSSYEREGDGNVEFAAVDTHLKPTPATSAVEPPPPPAVAQADDEPSLVRRSERARSLPSSLTDYQARSTRSHMRRLILSVRRVGKKAVGPSYGDSPTLKQALSSPDAGEWIAAIEKELDSLQALGAYEIVVRPPCSRRDLIPCHLVLRQKRFADGTPDKKKARLVANGNRQGAHLFNETYSPTARPITVKIALQIAAVQSYFIKCFDVGSAFLRSDIDTDIYISIPAVGSRPECFAKLKKSLYGLKQAGRLWYQEITAALLQFGCTQSAYDPCLFIKHSDKSDGAVMYVVLHVDDMLVVSSDEDQPCFQMSKKAPLGEEIV